MRVITLNPSQVLEHVHVLESAMAQNFVPDLVVALERGGVYVAEHMFPDIPQTKLTISRSTPGSKPLLRPIYKYLPRVVLNYMRMAQAKWLETRKTTVVAAEPGKATVDAIKNAGKILVVDDSVDSGKTLECAVAIVKGINPEGEVRSAVITVTTAHPIFMPDYFIYNNRTLVRYPLSADYFE